jgi:hypothetical protein
VENRIVALQKQLSIKLLYDPAIPLLGIYSKKQTQTGIYIATFIAVLFTKAKI